MPKSTVDAEARAQLAALGLNPDAPALDAPMPTPQQHAAPAAALVPEGVDSHSIPVADIEWDAALLDGFPALDDRQERAAASRYLFDLYKSPPRQNSDRNRRLHDEIGLFILRVRRSRESGTEHIKDKIRASKGQGDLMAFLAQHGIESVEDLKNKIGDA